MRLHALLLAAPLFVAHGAASQNLLVSPDFDVASDVDDWPDPFPDGVTTIGWQADLDVDASPSSGSLRLTTTITSGAADGPRQCVDTAPGAYEMEAWVFNPSQLPQPQTFIGVTFYPDPGCTGPSLGLASQFPPGALDVWESNAMSFEAPSGTSSLGVRVFSGNTIDPTPVTVYYDAIFLPEPGDPLGVGAGVLALAVLARRRATTARRRS